MGAWEWWAFATVATRDQGCVTSNLPTPRAPSSDIKVAVVRIA